jgi:hypothetical protein
MGDQEPMMGSMMHNLLGFKCLTLLIFVPNHHEDLHTHLLMSLFHELQSK